MAAEWLVIYVPHPAHGHAKFDHPVFSDNQVLVYRDSVLCWLISDLCVSLLSSAVFEGENFGARGFTPLTASDGFYTEACLDLLRHPQSTSFDDFVSEFRDFILGYSRAARVDVARRSRKRLELMRRSTTVAEGDVVGAMSR